MKKKHLIILIILIVLTAVYFIARSRQPVEKEKRFFTPDSAGVFKMEFFTSQDTIIVEKKDGAWRLTYPIAWDVNEEHLALFFKQVMPIKTSLSPVSEDHKMFSLYKVDEESAVQVILYNSKGRKIDHAYIGNGTNTAYDYGRKNGDWKTYQFKNNITNLVQPDIFQWRSPNITNLRRSQINKIDVTYSKNSYQLTVFADSVVYTDKKDTFTIPPSNRAQYKIVNALENLRTWQYIDKDTEQYRNLLKNPDCIIKVHLHDNKTKTFTLVNRDEKQSVISDGKPEGAGDILMMIDNKITPLYLMTGDFINRFTRASNHFKSEYE